MENHHFNLINQLNQEQKSLLRIENHYLRESKDVSEKKFWQKMKVQKKKNVAELSKMVKKYL